MWRIGLVVFVTSCSLYFSSGDDAANPPPDGDTPLDGGLTSGDTIMARCEDGALYRVGVAAFSPNLPGHGAGTVFDHCAGACRSAAVFCEDADCSTAAATLCEAAPSTGEPCALEGASCTGTNTTECPASTTCGYSVPGASCVCGSGGTYTCTEHTPIAAVHAALVGKWRGTVMPPSFSEPYTVSLWIYPDGTYWAERDPPGTIAFYYGGDGPHPDRKISMLSTSVTEGGWANIGIYFGLDPANIGAIASLVVDANKLRFTFFASWFDCGQPFFFDLDRE